LLFSATLVAAFAPGFVALIILSGDDSESGKQMSVIWSDLTSGVGRMLPRYKGMWKSIVALIAPALAAPLMDLLAIAAG